jgi:pyruvate formate lyase activating enzyme
MLLGGYQKLTLIDYPGKLATTVFTVGCSFCCPFCHNPELVSSIKYQVSSILESEFFAFLKKRQEKLEGVCITGGEPTIQPDLIDFIKKIKKLGYFIKLDTNGTRPDVLRQLFKEKLLDYVAMDIKNSPEKYLKTAGIVVGNAHARSMLDRVKLSVDLIRNSSVTHEFRTTVVPELHTEKDFEKIAEWIGGAKAYSLQKYQDAKIIDPKLRRRIKGKSLNLEKIRKNIEKHFGKVIIRD